MQVFDLDYTDVFFFEIAAKMSGFRCQICKGSLMTVHYPKLHNMVHLIAFNVLLLPKDLTTIFYLYSYIDRLASYYVDVVIESLV